jgi:transposase
VHQTWRTPASSSTRSPATSWAPRVGRCWPPWLAGSVICRCWPGWPVAGCPACCPVAPSAAGPVRGPHARLVRLARAHLEHLEGAIAARDRRVDEVITRFARARDRLDTITGVGKRAAETIIAEIGADMSVFLPPPTWPPGRAAARATTAPAARAARASRPGQPLAGGADRVPWAAARSRDTDLSAQDWRLARRIGNKKAAVAVGHSILVIAWYLLTDDGDDQDLGATTSSGATPSASVNGRRPAPDPRRPRRP